MKNKIARFFGRLLGKLVKLALIMVPCFVFGAMAFSTSSLSYASNDVLVDTTPQKIEALKVDLVTRLSDCERAGRDESYGLISFDNNSSGTLTGQNIPSIGVLQFKIRTVQSTYKQLYGVELSGKEAVELALDKSKAFALAKDIIFQNIQGGIDNWHNCSVKYKLADEVKIINKLAK